MIAEAANNLNGIVLLFGSFAKDQQNKDSDVDLLQVISNSGNRKAKERMPKEAIKHLEESIGREINLKIANKLEFMNGLKNGNPLIREVVLNHIILKGSEDFCNLMWEYYGKR
ncbi:MAG: nucleotidyltransferase domain-containing protein [Nitrososphaerales archaeon]